MSRRAALAIASAAGLALAAPALAVNVWTGAGDGVSWNDPANWSDNAVPGTTGNQGDVEIGDGQADVLLASVRTIANLTVNADDQLTVNQGGGLTFTGGVLANDGVLNLNADPLSGSDLVMNFNGPTGSNTIAGSGEIVMSDDANNVIQGISRTIVHGVDHTIRGSGRLLSNIGGMINDGTILAQGATPLVIDPGSQGFTNNGTLRAEGSGGLTLVTGTYTNNTSIDVADGSEARVGNAANIIGGTLNSTGSGRFLANSGSAFTGVTVGTGGNVVVPDAASINVSNGLTNNGTWTLDALNASGSTVLMTFVGGDQTLDGNGEIVMSDDPNNILRPFSSTLTHGDNHTIRGAGNLLNNVGGIINNGTIVADGTNTLVIDPGSQGFVNNGTLRAEGTGGLTLVAGDFTNNSSIDAADGSEVRVNNAANIIGGTLNSVGSGRFVANPGSEFTGVTVSAGSNVVVPDAASINVSNGLTNNGIWTLDALNASGSAVFMTFFGDETLSGSGQLIMSDDPNNVARSFSATLTHGPDHTIQGAGNLLNNVGGMINDGTIIADGTNALVIDPASQGFTNNGTLRAEGSGGLTLSTGSYTNNSTMHAADGSEIRVNNAAEIIGGTLSSSGTGRIVATSGSDFNGVTTAVGSSLVVPDAQSIDIRDGLTNNGNWALDAINTSGFGVFMTFFGDQTLDGSGQIIMSDDPNNVLRSFSATLTHEADHTIRGAGTLLANTGGMINNGTILAEGVNDLVIDPASQGFINNGIIGGDGSIDFIGNFTNDGTIAPGTSIGTLDWDGDIINAATAVFAVEAGALGAADLLAIEGIFEADGVIDLALLASVTDVAGEVFTVLTASGGVSGAFANAVPDASGIAIGVQSNGLVFDVTYLPTEIRISNIVPAPGTGLLALGGIGLASVRRRRSS